jgi:hypothetical protein
MCEQDRDHFLATMDKEVKDQMDNRNFTIVKRSKVPKGKTILPAVWQMKQKHDIKTRILKKYKAKLKIGGSQMKREFIMMKPMHLSCHGSHKTIVNNDCPKRVAFKTNRLCFSLLSGTSQKRNIYKNTKGFSGRGKM